MRWTARGYVIGHSVLITPRLPPAAGGDSTPTIRPHTPPRESARTLSYYTDGHVTWHPCETLRGEVVVLDAIG